MTLLTPEQRAGREAMIAAIRAVHEHQSALPYDARQRIAALEAELAADAAQRQERQSARRQKRAAAGRTWHTEGVPES